MSGDTPSSRLAADIARFEAAVTWRRANRDYVPYTDFEELLDGGGAPEPRRPDVLARTDGAGLFYRGEWAADGLSRTEGRVNSLYGDREAGKTMVAMAAIANELSAAAVRGHGAGGALFLDVDGNGPEEVAARLLMLGAPPDELISLLSFEHYRPRDAVQVLDAVRSYAEGSDCGVAVIDSVDEVMAMFGADPNKGDDYSAVMHAVTDPLVRAGHCVLLIDHTGKTSDGRGPGGTVVKQRLVTGASVEVRPKRQFVPGRGGAAELWVVKDRDGGLRSRCPEPGAPRQLAGTFVLDPPAPDGTAAWRVESPLAAQPNAPGGGATDWKAAAAAMAGPFGVDQLAAAVTGATTRSHQEMARRAIKVMTRAGELRVAREGGGRGNPTLWEVVA